MTQRNPVPESDVSPAPTPRTALQAFDDELAALDGTRGKPRPMWAVDRLRRAIERAAAAPLEPPRPDHDVSPTTNPCAVVREATSTPLEPPPAPLHGHQFNGDWQECTDEHPVGGTAPPLDVERLQRALELAAGQMALAFGPGRTPGWYAVALAVRDQYARLASPEEASQP